MDSNRHKLPSDVPRNHSTPLHSGPGGPLVPKPKREAKPPRYTCPNHSTGKPGCSDQTCSRYIPVVKVATSSRGRSPITKYVASTSRQRDDTRRSAPSLNPTFSSSPAPYKESVVPAVIRVPTAYAAGSPVPEVVRASSSLSCYREVLISPSIKNATAPPEELRVRVPPDSPVALVNQEVLSESLDASDIDDTASVCSSPSDYSTWSTAATGSSETADTPRILRRTGSTIAIASDEDSDAGIFFPIRRAPASIRSHPAPVRIQTLPTDLNSVAQCSTRTKISSRSGGIRSSTTRARTPSDSQAMADPSGKSRNVLETPPRSSSSSTLAQRAKNRPKQEAHQGSFTAHAQRDPILGSHSSSPRQQPPTQTHTESERSESRIDFTESEFGFNILVSEYGNATSHHSRHATVRVNATNHGAHGERHSRPQSQVSVPDSDSGSYVTTSTVQSRTPARPTVLSKSQSMFPLAKLPPLSVLEARAREDGFSRYADPVPESTRAVNSDSAKGKQPAKAANMVVAIFKNGLKPKEHKRLNPEDLFE